MGVALGRRPASRRNASTANVKAISPSAKARHHFSFFLQAIDWEAKASIRSLIYASSYRVAGRFGSNQQITPIHHMEAAIG
jgi:hypothetical protein